MARTAALAAVLAVALIPQTMSCESCRKGSAAARRTLPDSPPEIPPAERAEPWTWQTSSAAPYGLPSGCRMLAAPRLHAAPASRLLFIATPGDIDHLAVATTSGDDRPLTSTRGWVDVAAQGDGGTVEDVPWVQAAAPPLIASAAGKCVAILAQSDAMGPQTRLWLWRSGSTMERMTEGDQLYAADLRCEGVSCALLTSRPTEVAAPGASLWTGDASRAAASWTRRDLAEDKKGLRPLSIVGFEPGARRTTIAFDSPDGIAFMAVQGDATSDLGTVPRSGKLVDTAMVGDRPAAVFATGEVTAEGCTPLGAKLRVEAAGRAEAEVALPEMPESGYARAVERGLFVGWVARVNCKDPRRKVVKGVLIASDGVAGPVMTLGDADGLAVSTSGRSLAVWLRVSAGVAEIRGTCDGR